jgi:hypothetical protein
VKFGASQALASNISASRADRHVMAGNVSDELAWLRDLQQAIKNFEHAGGRGVWWQ